MAVYEFLWSKSLSMRDSYYAKNIKAKSLESACKKFKNGLSMNAKWVDYEVREGDVFHNITGNELFKDLI